MPAVELVGATAPGARTCAPSTPSPARPGAGAHFVEALEQEWHALVRSDLAAATVQQWGRRHPVALAGCRTPADVLIAVRTSPDRTLLALLEQVSEGDMVAGRVVVQTMLPKLITMSRRDREHELADYVSWLWLVASAYPVARRRHRVAANLALDTLKEVTRHRQRREIPYRSESLDLLESERWAARTGGCGPDGDLVDTLTAATVINNAFRLGLLDDLTVRVLTVVYDHGLPGKEAAAQLGMSVDSVRWRCSRAVRRLASHAADLLAAA